MLQALATSIPVLVTGASSGIGEEFALQFAERGHDVHLVARRTDRLEKLAKKLNRLHGVEARVHSADLMEEKGVASVVALLTESPSWIVVNNAGFGSSGAFARLDAQKERDEVMLNVVAVHQITHAALARNLAAREGGIINVASTAAYQPMPFMATYAATKAFVLHFTEAVATEYEGSGVRIMALCPGPVTTEFSTVAHVEELERMMPSMPADRCVRQALVAFDKNRVICIPGMSNAAMAVGSRLSPKIVVRKALRPVLKRGHSS